MAGSVRIALQAQRRHQAVERQVLVRQRVAHAAAHPIHQRGEARITGKVRAQRQHVDEEPRHPRQVRVGPVRRRRPDDDVLLPAVARHQQVEGREQHREQGRAPGPRQRVQRRRHVPVHRHVMVPAVVAHDRWARVVRRQLETRGAGQSIAPVLQLERQYLVREPRPLPRRDVRELHPELHKRRRPPRHRRPVQLPQLAHQQVHRPAVAQDVMLDEDEDVRGRTRPQQPSPVERRSAQIEPPPRFRRDHAIEVQAVERLDRQRHLPRRMDHLVRHPVRLDEARAQHLVPRHQAAENAATSSAPRSRRTVGML